MKPSILNAETQKARGKTAQPPALLQIALALLVLAAAFGNAFGAVIDEKTATAVADFWFKSELNSENSKIEADERTARLEQMQQRTVLYMISSKDVVDKLPDGATVLAYVIVYQPTGYVIVSGENRIEPVIAFDVSSQFQWEGEAAGFAREFLGATITNRWKAIDAKDAEDPAAPELDAPARCRSDERRCERHVLHTARHSTLGAGHILQRHGVSQQRKHRGHPHRLHRNRDGNTVPIPRMAVHRQRVAQL